MEKSNKNKEFPGSEQIQARRLVSKRDIGIQAFELENGNLMLEATLLDPYHLIRFNIQIEPETKTIIYAKSEFSSHPHTACPLVAAKADSIIGLKIQRGITKLVSQRIGGVDGCVHLKELALETINFAATTLMGYDYGFGLMSREFNILEENKRFEISKHILKNSCHVYKER